MLFFYEEQNYLLISGRKPQKRIKAKLKRRTDRCHEKMETDY